MVLPRRGRVRGAAGCVHGSAGCVHGDAGRGLSGAAGKVFTWCLHGAAGRLSGVAICSSVGDATCLPEVATCGMLTPTLSAARLVRPTTCLGLRLGLGLGLGLRLGLGLGLG